MPINRDDIGKARLKKKIPRQADDSLRSFAASKHSRVSQGGGIVSGYEKFQKVETKKENTDQSEDKKKRKCTKKETGWSIFTILAIMGILAAVPVTREFFIDLFEGLFKDGDSIESSNTTLFTTSAYLTTTIFTTTASVDPCLSSPCQNNGTCSSSGQSFSCSCTQPYEGDNCEKFRPCNDSPCQNNSTCWVKDGDYYCDCPSDFLGKNCAEPFCGNSSCYTGPSTFCNQTDSCFNGGLCNTYQENSTSIQNCTCMENYSGDRCEQVDGCDTYGCQNGALCSRNDTHNICHCNDGYSGEKCEITPCDSNPCQNGGVCSPDHDTYSCACPAGYSGATCSTEKCDPGCVAGTCELNTTTSNFYCDCPDNMSGSRCEVNPCAPNPCQNGGLCSFETNSTHANCSCPITGNFTYGGSFCQIAFCSHEPCDNEGVCQMVQNNETYLWSPECVCQPSTSGETCEVVTCSSSCQNGGTCQYSNGGAGCICQSHYSGSDCGSHPCDTNTCQPEETCSSLNSSHYECT